MARRGPRPGARQHRNTAAHPAPSAQPRGSAYLQPAAAERVRHLVPSQRRRHAALTLQISYRLPQDLADKLVTAAERAGLSVSGLLGELVLRMPDEILIPSQRSDELDLNLPVAGRFASTGALVRHLVATMPVDDAGRPEWATTAPLPEQTTLVEVTDSNQSDHYAA